MLCADVHLVFSGVFFDVGVKKDATVFSDMKPFSQDKLIVLTA